MTVPPVATMPVAMPVNVTVLMPVTMTLMRVSMPAPLAMTAMTVASNGAKRHQRVPVSSPRFGRGVLQ